VNDKYRSQISRRYELQLIADWRKKYSTNETTPAEYKRIFEAWSTQEVLSNIFSLVKTTLISRFKFPKSCFSAEEIPTGSGPATIWTVPEEYQTKLATYTNTLFEHIGRQNTLPEWIGKILGRWRRPATVIVDLTDFGEDGAPTSTSPTQIHPVIQSKAKGGLPKKPHVASAAHLKAPLSGSTSSRQAHETEANRVISESSAIQIPSQTNAKRGRGSQLPKQPIRPSSKKSASKSRPDAMVRSNHGMRALQGLTSLLEAEIEQSSSMSAEGATMPSLPLKIASRPSTSQANLTKGQVGAISNQPISSPSDWPNPTHEAGGNHAPVVPADFSRGKTVSSTNLANMEDLAADLVFFAVRSEGATTTVVAPASSTTTEEPSIPPAEENGASAGPLPATSTAPSEAPNRLPNPKKRPPIHRGELCASDFIEPPDDTEDESSSDSYQSPPPPLPKRAKIVGAATYRSKPGHYRASDR
jgi:hypothetical protein